MERISDLERTCVYHHTLCGSHAVEGKSNITSLAQLGHNKNSRRLSVPFSSPAWRGMFHLPRVHAAENEGDADKSSLEKMEARRPEVVVTDSEVLDFLQKETGWDRVHNLFSKDNNNQYHPELVTMVAMNQNCTLAAFMLGCIPGARAARVKFLEKNRHIKYDTQFLAKRKLNDAIVVGSIKSGFSLAVKTFFSTGIFITTMQCVATYRNKSSVFEYIGAGVLTCSLMRFSLGPKGMFAGGVIGGVLGAIGGSVICLIMKALNETQDQRHWQDVYDTLRIRKEHALIGKPSPAATLLQQIDAHAMT